MKTIFYPPLIWGMLFFSSLSFSFDDKNSIDVDQVSAQCFSKEWGKQSLITLKTNKFMIDSNVKKEVLVMQLLHCLAHPDAKIRDGVAFEALSYWLRTDQLNQLIHIEMFNFLTHVLVTKVDDSNGVYQSFSMLVLSEVARVDRKTPFLTPKQRDYLVNVGTDYLTHLKDYRGFSDNIGWRHGVAHSSDLMLQLALNPAINKPQLDIILKSLASQIIAHQQHSYVNGEPKRIAMAVLYVFLRGEYSIDDWNDWLNKTVEPFPFKQWQHVYQSEKGLIKLHNTQSFLYALYATIKSSDNQRLIQMVPALEKAIKDVN
jgi:hypothetical protein